MARPIQTGTGRRRLEAGKHGEEGSGPNPLGRNRGRSRPRRGEGQDRRRPDSQGLHHIDPGARVKAGPSPSYDYYTAVGKVCSPESADRRSRPTRPIARLDRRGNRRSGEFLPKESGRRGEYDRQPGHESLGEPDGSAFDIHGRSHYAGHDKCRKRRPDDRPPGDPVRRGRSRTTPGSGDRWTRRDGRSPAGPRILIPGYPQWSWRQRERAADPVRLLRRRRWSVGVFAWGTAVGLAVLAFAFADPRVLGGRRDPPVRLPGLRPVGPGGHGLGRARGVCYAPALAGGLGLRLADRARGAASRGLSGQPLGLSRRGAPSPARRSGSGRPGGPGPRSPGSSPAPASGSSGRTRSSGSTTGRSRSRRSGPPARPAS